MKKPKIKLLPHQEELLRYLRVRRHVVVAYPSGLSGKCAKEWIQLFDQAKKHGFFDGL